MLEELKLLWSRYSNREYVDIGGAKLRLASNRAQARYFVNPPSKPTGEIRLLSSIDINHGWQCQVNSEWIQLLDLTQTSMSLRELQLQALKETQMDADFPYLWWFHKDNNPKKRTVYEDSLGVSYIKLDNVWQVVYSCKKLGTLVGNQGQGGYEDIPPNAFFVIIENGRLATPHSVSYTGT